MRKLLFVCHKIIVNVIFQTASQVHLRTEVTASAPYILTLVQYQIERQGLFRKFKIVASFRILLSVTYINDYLGWGRESYFFCYHLLVIMWFLSKGFPLPLDAWDRLRYFIATLRVTLRLPSI